MAKRRTARGKAAGKFHKILRNAPRNESLERRLLFAVGNSFSIPVNPSSTTDISPSWVFALNPTGTPQSPSYDTSSWKAVNLPYTFDPYSNSDPSGDGWYRKTVTITPSMVGSEIYLQFLGGSLATTVYVDGTKVGATHYGGWEAFDIDVTSQMTAGSHLIAVDVNNNGNSAYVPANGGDYTHEGGLYRTVSLLAVNKSHVALTEPVITPDTSGNQVAGSGVYFSNSTVITGATSATVQFQTQLDNLSTSAAPLTVTSFLVDAGGIIRAQQTSSLSLNASQTDLTVTQSATVANPHLWNGLADPYLYDLYVEVSNTSTGALVDVNHQQVGIRSMSLSATSGFYLNGSPYKLVGVDMHQDSGAPGPNGTPAGWAETDAQQQDDINQALAMGSTIIRTSHYQRDPAFYSYCDQKGMIVETEFGLNDNVTNSTTFTNNAEDMLTEMIRQNFNHPSVVIWSLYNEIGNSTTNGALITTLTTMTHTLDTTGRFTLAETDDGTATDTINTAPDTTLGTSSAPTGGVNYHPYNGWYGGDPAAIASTLQGYHNSEPTEPIGVGEFGAGASDYQYTNTITLPPASTTLDYHPENAQTQIIEEQYAAIASQSFVFDDIAWQMFDMSSIGRNEGDAYGVNDKGLVTRDRLNYKDAYYFYQANWNSPTSTRGYNTTPVIWISDHSWTDRNGSSTVPLTVYSNVGAPTLTLNNGTSITLTPLVLDGMTIPDAYSTSSKNITLQAGNNTLLVSGSVNGHTYTNSDVWNYHASTFSGTPVASVEFTSGTVQSGYAADTGAAYGARGNNATFGWVTPVAEVDTLTPSGTISAGDVDTIKLPSGHAVSYTVVGTTTAAAVSLGLANAWNADLTAIAVGSASVTSTGTLLITANVAGTPLGISSSVAGTGTLPKVITTAASTNATANTSGTYYRSTVTTAPFNTVSAQTGIILNPGNVWQYQVPNGVYDLHIVGSDSSASNLVDNLSVNGTTLHATSFSTTGGTFQEFYATVTVSNGLISITGGPGVAYKSGNIVSQGRLSSVQINQISLNSAVAVTSNNSSPSVGQSVQFTATVTPGTSAGGTVQFQIDGNNVGSPVNVVSGVATYTTSSLSVGNHSIVAVYNGDGTYTTSVSLAFSQTVNKVASTIAVGTQPSAITYDGTTNVTSWVNPTVNTAAGAPAPTGTPTVVYYANSATSGTPLASSPLDAGNYTVVVSYAGDANYAAAQTSVTFTVARAATTTTLPTPPSPDTANGTTSVTKWVVPSVTGVPGAPPPNGKVSIAYANSSGTILSSTPTTPGTYTVYAVYRGNSNYLPSNTSTTFTISPPAALTTSMLVNGIASSGTVSNSQRSQVTSLTLNFNAAVTVSANAITLTDQDASNPFGAAGASVPFTLVPSSGNQTYTLTFSGTNFVNRGSLGTSLPNGHFALSINFSGVTSSSATVPSGSQSLLFHRLYGDLNNAGYITTTAARFDASASNFATYEQYLDNDGADFSAGFDSADNSALSASQRFVTGTQEQNLWSLYND